MTPWTDNILLAPMSRGSNLPFRRLCLDFGAKVTMSEMVFAEALADGNRRDKALLRKAPQEECFGAQILACKPEAAALACQKAAEEGASFVDLNAGCPINEAVKKGLGSRLLERPRLLQDILEAMRRVSPVPVTAKLRIGFKEGRNNIEETGRLAQEAGVSGLTIHGRTREQRYTGTSDWTAIKKAADDLSVPVIGNGDILTWYEAEDKTKDSNIYGIMIGRGALIKPWIFQELKEKRTLCPSVSERVDIYRRLASYMLEHFGDDERGKKTSLSFLTWHFDFFSRWRYLPEDQWREASRQYPLLQTRLDLPKETPLDTYLALGDKTIREQTSALIIESISETTPWAVKQLETRALEYAKNKIR